MYIQHAVFRPSGGANPRFRTAFAPMEAKGEIRPIALMRPSPFDDGIERQFPRIRTQLQGSVLATTFETGSNGRASFLSEPTEGFLENFYIGDEEFVPSRLRLSIGEGACGKILRFDSVHDPDQFLAVKFLPITSQSSEELVEYEAMVLRKLSNHPSIVQLMDFQQIPGWGLLIMEPLGRPISELLDKNDLNNDVRWIREIIHDLVKAMQFIHSQGFVHCDLKPSNLVYDTNAHIKVIDFGAAREIGLCVQRHTPQYAPLDMDHYLATPAFDIWSLGIICFELGHGKPPMAVQNSGSRNASDAMDQLSVEITASNFPLGLLNLITKCLVRDPCGRASSGSLLAHRFFIVAKETPIDLLCEEMEEIILEGE